MSTPFDAGTLDLQRQGLANLLPNDRLFAAKNIMAADLYKLLKGISGESLRIDQRIEDITIQHDLRITTDLLSRWEAAFGIPDDCFAVNDISFEDRRRNVLAKIKASGCTTEQDFIVLAAFLGYTIQIIHLVDVAFPPYDVPFIPTSFPGVRFVWIIQGDNVTSHNPPYDVPFDLNIGSTVLECFFQKLKPANTVLIFRNT